MNRKLIWVFALAVITLIILTGVVAAKADFETVVTDNGGTHVEAGIAEVSENTDEYEIRYNGRRVITVRYSNAFESSAPVLFSSEEVVNGYYSVEFEVSEEEGTSAFIAGLSKSNKDEIQKALINAAYSEKRIDFESLDFIDAEKVSSPDRGDDKLCWAATTSNMLMYTGWGRAAGFENEDDILEVFIDSFTDSGSNGAYAIQWFLNGYYIPQNWEAWGDEAHVREHGSSGAYFPEYSAYRIMKSHMSMPGDIRKVTDALRSGAGVYTAVDWLTEGQANGGHALTLWGYIYDNRYETERIDDPDYLKAIIVADSDSDRSNEERRMSLNKLHVCNTLRYTEYGYNTWTLNTSFNGNGVISSFVTLLPYSETLEKETSSDATLDTFTTTDFTVTDLYFVCDEVPLNVFSENTAILLLPLLTLNSVVPFNGSLDYTVEIGSQVYRKTSECSYMPNYYYFPDPIEISGLAPGEYDVKVTLNPDKSIAEAHFYDNTITGRIKVTDDAPDISGAKMTATISEQTGGSLDVSFNYENTDNIFPYMGEKYETDVFAAYYEDGEWSNWETVAENYDSDGSFPQDGTIRARGTKVKFKALAYNADKPSMAVYSDEYDIYYIMFSLNSAEDNTFTYTKLPENAAALAQSEKFAFEIHNTSTYDAANAVFNASVVFVNKNHNENTVIYKANDLTVARGDPLRIEVSDWSPDIKLSGHYSVYAVIDSEYTAENVFLGYLDVKEAQSIVVDTDIDELDEYDGRTSLREAVALCGENDVVTITPDMVVLSLDAPIVIDKPVAIDLRFEDTEGTTENPYGAQLGSVIYAYNKCRIFEVRNGGSLKLCGVAMIAGKAKETGGAIYIDGGTAELSQCRIFECSSGRAGGGIYVTNGGLILNGCSFKHNESGYGGAVAADDTGSIDMLNCTLFGNTSNAGAVYTSGHFTAVNSIFEGNTAKASGATSVTAAEISDAALINCIATDERALNGNVRVYSCILGETDYSGDAHGSKLNVPAANVFKTDENGEVIWVGYSDWRCIQYAAHLSKTAEMPASVKNENGYVALEYDGTNTLMTDTPSVFSDEDLVKDAYGNPRGRFCGSMRITEDEENASLSDKNLTVFVYEGTEATVICAAYDDGGNIKDISVVPTLLENGTNIIPLYKIEAGENNAANSKYMVWQRRTAMKPLCSSMSGE